MVPVSKVVPDGPITCFEMDCATKVSEKDKYVIEQKNNLGQFSCYIIL